MVPPPVLDVTLTTEKSAVKRANNNILRIERFQATTPNDILSKLKLRESLLSEMSHHILIRH